MVTYVDWELSRDLRSPAEKRAQACISRWPRVVKYARKQNVVQNLSILSIRYFIRPPIES